MLGQEVILEKPNTMNSVLDMSTLQHGAYFVKVTIGNVTKTIRVIKE
ncbi:T9SS type A sorting domain-containing protein [Lacinutrix sp. C3R15]|nr:T9SS type A sorting domain-containing protein [Lacinutrix sp. C3R15]